MDSVEQERAEKNIFVHRTAKVFPGVELEEGVHIGAYCVIGAQAEKNKDWHTLPVGKVIIRKGAVLTGLVTVDSGSDGVTEIGAHSFLMKHAHVGHDAVLGQNVTLSPGARIGGECTVGDWANVGMNAVVHQQMAVPKKCMLGMGCVVTKKAAAQMKPCETWVGNPARKIGMNKKWTK